MDTSIVPQADESTNLKCGGIYQFRQLSTGKKYIGSTNNFKKRKWTHLDHIKKRIHKNPHLLSAWLKYGSDDFEFSILEIIENESELIAREQWYLDNVIDFEFDFNISKMADRPPLQKCSDEARARMSRAGMGRIFSPETKQKIADANRGRIRSDEARKNMSQAKRNISDETRQKMSESHKGVPLSEERIRRRRETQRGISDETRRKLSDAAKRQWKRVRQAKKGST